MKTLIRFDSDTGEIVDTDPLSPFGEVYRLRLSSIAIQNHSRFIVSYIKKMYDNSRIQKEDSDTLIAAILDLEKLYREY